VEEALGQGGRIKHHDDDVAPVKMEQTRWQAKQRFVY
jgi:hypothetical protein